jgi:hypothetical protein
VAVPARRARELAPARRPALRPVPAAKPTPAPRRRPRRIPFLLFATALVTGLLILLAGAQAIVAQGAFRLSELGERAERLEVDTDLLRLRVAELSTPDRIAEAGRRAGLVRAERVEVLEAR